MKRIFDYKLTNTTAVILSTGSGDKYQECAADISDDEIMAIAVALADHTTPHLRSDEAAYVQTGWLIIDQNNDGDSFSLTDENGHCVIEATPEHAQELFVAYVRESVENNVDVSEANLDLLPRRIFCHGCGDEIFVDVAHWHDGDGYCEGCEDAPAED
jgi:hypothetical protein